MKVKFNNGEFDIEDGDFIFLINKTDGVLKDKEDLIVGHVLCTNSWLEIHYPYCGFDLIEFDNMVLDAYFHKKIDCGI